MLGSLGDLSPGRDHSSMWAISQGNLAMKIAHFERMGLNGLSLNPFNLARE